jgi:hypothetical protein
VIVGECHLIESVEELQKVIVVECHSKVADELKIVAALSEVAASLS